MFAHHIHNLHAPMMAGGLRGLAGPSVLLQTDKQSYLVGEKPTYAISGGAPGAAIAWTSFKDGVATGEYQAYYGQSLDAEGKAVLVTDTPWGDEHIGLWQKQVIVLNPDGSQSLGQAFFTVAKTAGAPEPAGAEPGLFDRKIQLFGVQIPLVGVVAVGGLAAFLFLKK